MTGESSAPAGAVLLSYASQDAAAAQCNAAAFWASWIEISFDKSELRGGDAWDQRLRNGFRDSTVIMPGRSARKPARHGGNPGVEWDFADQRMRIRASACQRRPTARIAPALHHAAEANLP